MQLQDEQNRNLRSNSTFESDDQLEQDQVNILLLFIGKNPWTIGFISFGTVVVCCIVTQILAQLAKKSNLQINKIKTLKKFLAQQKSQEGQSYSQSNIDGVQSSVNEDE